MSITSLYCEYKAYTLPYLGVYSGVKLVSVKDVKYANYQKKRRSLPSGHPSQKSPTGKREYKYFDYKSSDREDRMSAERFIKEYQANREIHGKHAVSPEELHRKKDLLLLIGIYPWDTPKARRV